MNIENVLSLSFKLDTASNTTVIPFYKRNHKSTTNPIYNFHGGLKGFFLTLYLYTFNPSFFCKCDYCKLNKGRGEYSEKHKDVYR